MLPNVVRIGGIVTLGVSQSLVTTSRTRRSPQARASSEPLSDWPYQRRQRLRQRSERRDRMTSQAKSDRVPIGIVAWGTHSVQAVTLRRRNVSTVRSVHRARGRAIASCVMIDRPVRVGLQIHPQHAEYAAIRRTVAAAEESGADVVFNWDHFYPLYGDLDGKHFECWTMLGAWAEQTSQIEIGALVTCNSYRNPDLLGDMARTVDHLSGGRLILGVGAGWFEKDYRNFGYDFGTPGTRLAALEDALPRIDARLAAGNPPPTCKVPLLIGGGGERKTLRQVARHADIWHTFGDAATIAHKRAVLEDWCAKERRDPAEIELSCGVDTEGDNARPEVFGEQLHAVGMRLFTVGVTGPDFDLGALQNWVAWRDDKNAG